MVFELVNGLFALPLILIFYNRQQGNVLSLIFELKYFSFEYTYAHICALKGRSRKKDTRHILSLLPQIDRKYTAQGAVNAKETHLRYTMQYYTTETRLFVNTPSVIGRQLTK